MRYWSGIPVPPLHDRVRVPQEPLRKGRIISGGMVTGEPVQGIKSGHIGAPGLAERPDHIKSNGGIGWDGSGGSTRGICFRTVKDARHLALLAFV